MTDLHLPPSTESVPAARRFAREQLGGSGCDVDTVVLLVSELVTNAVLHARSEVLLSVEDLGETAWVQVVDSSPMPPRLHSFAVESATGRGLRMLDKLAVRWGVEPDTDGPGKVVWFEVGVPSESAWDSFAETLAAEGAPGDL